MFIALFFFSYFHLESKYPDTIFTPIILIVRSMTSEKDGARVTNGSKLSISSHISPRLFIQTFRLKLYFVRAEYMNEFC